MFTVTVMLDSVEKVQRFVSEVSILVRLILSLNTVVLMLSQL